jgi:hypothetical protein
MVLLISIFLLSACGGDTTTTITGTSEGTADGPFVLDSTLVNTDSPHSGTVGNKSVGKSYYTAAVTSGITYTITLYGLSADADLEVYNDRPFDYILGPECTSRNGSTSVEYCTVTAIGATMKIAVNGQYTSEGATFSISVNGPDAATACVGITGCIDFEDGVFPTSFLSAGTGLDWNIDTTEAVNGTYNIRSGAIAHSETSCFSYTPTDATSYASFNLRVSSEQYNDLLLFYIDDVLQPPVWSGTVNWQRVIFNTVSATHTYKWCYSKNSTATVGSDLARLDDILIK